jgi:hypothetical protein
MPRRSPKDEGGLYMHYVYILQSISEPDRFYTGETSNLKYRFENIMQVNPFILINSSRGKFIVILHFLRKAKPWGLSNISKPLLADDF